MYQKNSIVDGAKPSSTNASSSSAHEQVSLLNYHGYKIDFERIEGKLMVNATQMAKPFGKQPVEWLRFKQAQELIKAISEMGIHSSADLQIVRRGGRRQGTWFHEDVALLFAQWLSPEFYILCNEKLKELFTKQLLTIPKKSGVSPVVYEGHAVYPYMDVMRALGGSTRSSASRRKEKYPQHFTKAFGRNFINSELFDLLKEYYDHRRAYTQLKLAL